MSEFGSKELAKRSREIDAQLKDAFKKAQEEEKKWKKIVLLGSSDCGKTTLLKQLKIVYGTGFTKEELAMYARAASDNVYDSTASLLSGVKSLGLSLAPETLKAMEQFSDERQKGDILSSELVDAVETIWNDPASQDAFKRRNQFQIQDTAQFFITNAKRLTAPGFVPSQDDVLLIRIMTTSISVTRLMVDKNGMDFIDVGGHKSFRFRWVPYLNESLACIFYVMSLAAYDQKMAEDKNTSRMDDAVELFHAIADNQLLSGIMMVVFFNKVDLFEEKIKTSLIETYYKDFVPNPSNNLQTGIAYFSQKFMTETDRSVIQHVTKATDTTLMRKILATVSMALIQQFLKSSGLA